MSVNRGCPALYLPDAIIFFPEPFQDSSRYYCKYRDEDRDEGIAAGYKNGS